MSSKRLNGTRAWRSTYDIDVDLYVILKQATLINIYPL